MKKLFMVLSATLMLMSCENYSADEIAGTSEKLVTFALSNGEAVTRATLEEMNITDLWLFDYVGDDLKNTVHKTDDFDAITLSMSYGEHTVCIVASRGADPTVTPPVISWAKPSDTLSPEPILVLLFRVFQGLHLLAFEHTKLQRNA